MIATYLTAVVGCLSGLFGLLVNIKCSSLLDSRFSGRQTRSVLYFWFGLVAPVSDSDSLLLDLSTKSLEKGVLAGAPKF